MPDWTELLRPRLQRLDLRAEREAEIAEELAQHLDERYAELLSQGLSETEAGAQALRELVDPDTLVEDLAPLRQARAPEPLPPAGEAASGRWWNDLWSDLRLTLRSWHRAPMFALVAVLTLALGIGANGAIFALVDATLLKPLPLPAPDRLLMLWGKTAGTLRDTMSAPDVNDLFARSHTLEALGGYVPEPGGMVISGADGMAQTVPRQWVTAGVFDALGIRPLLGRTFKLADDREGALLVLLGETFWRERFGADPAIVGTTLRLDGDPFTVLGVVPETARLMGDSDLWAMFSTEDRSDDARDSRFLRVVARLKPGVDLATARADLDTAGAALARDYPNTNSGRGVQLDPLKEALTGTELRATALLFIGAVGFVLLICCANVANLLLARAAQRSREMAIRVALGAQRGRLARQVLAECLLLALLGGLLGLALGVMVIQSAPQMLPAGLLPGAVALAVDLRLMGFSAVVALLVAVLFGLAPAWQAARTAPARALVRESAGGPPRAGRLRRALVVAEVATAVMVLFGAGLLLRTLLTVEQIDRGYRADGVATLLVDPLGDRYPDRADLLRFYDEVERAVRDVHDVQQLAWASGLPLGAHGSPILVEAARHPVVDLARLPASDFEIVSPGYFETVSIALKAGRDFDARDTADSQRVAIVNEVFARQHFGERSPIGERLKLRRSPEAAAPVTEREIVGVVGGVLGRSEETQAPPQLYVPLRQAPTDDIYLLVKARQGAAHLLLEPIRAAIAVIDRAQLVSVREMLTLSEIANNATTRPRFRALLVLCFAALALTLAMVGVFGLLAWSVQQQRRDFGVRLALGASRGAVLRLVLRGAARLIGLGSVIGLALALLLGPVLATLLVGVPPLDPITLLAVVAVIVMAAIVSVAAPAWRAARIDGMAVLRGD